MRDDVTRWAWAYFIFYRKLYSILKDVELEYTEQRDQETDSTMLNITKDFKTGNRPISVGTT